MGNPTDDVDPHADFAFSIVKFYEEAAGNVKSRTWTISAWIFSLNSALLAFSYSLPKDAVFLFGERDTVIAACLAGIALCVAQITLVANQGIHLRDYMAHQLSARRLSQAITTTIDLGKQKPSVPRFCKILIGLGAFYAGGFFFTLWRATCVVT